MILVTGGVAALDVKRPANRQLHFRVLAPEFPKAANGLEAIIRRDNLRIRFRIAIDMKVSS